MAQAIRSRLADAGRLVKVGWNGAACPRSGKIGLDLSAAMERARETILFDYSAQVIQLIRESTVAGLLAGTASAQFYEPPSYGYRGPSRYDYDRGPPHGYDDRYERRSHRFSRRFGDTCVTSRGACETNPAPRGSACRCYIEEFGPKPGNID